MAEEQKRKKKWAYLEDFHKNSKGGYEYHGKYFRCVNGTARQAEDGGGLRFGVRLHSGGRMYPCSWNDGNFLYDPALCFGTRMHGQHGMGAGPAEQRRNPPSEIYL